MSVFHKLRQSAIIPQMYRIEIILKICCTVFLTYVYKYSLQTHRKIAISGSREK